MWLCACVGLWFIERGMLHLECAFLRFCAFVSLWFIERGILHLECAFLGFCACVGISFIERGMCGFALVLVYGLWNEEYYIWSVPFFVFALLLVYGL